MKRDLRFVGYMDLLYSNANKIIKMSLIVICLFQMNSQFYNKT